MPEQRHRLPPVLINLRVSGLNPGPEKTRASLFRRRRRRRRRRLQRQQRQQLQQHQRRRQRQQRQQPIGQKSVFVRPDHFTTNVNTLLFNDHCIINRFAHLNVNLVMDPIRTSEDPPPTTTCSTANF